MVAFVPPSGNEKPLGPWAKWTFLLINNKQTYEVLKRDPTPALQRKQNNKLLTLKKTEKIDFRRYNRLSGGAVFRSHPSCVDYQNYTNPIYLYPTYIKLTGTLRHV